MLIDQIQDNLGGYKFPLLVLQELRNCLPSTCGIDCTNHAHLSCWYILVKHVLSCTLRNDNRFV